MTTATKPEGIWKFTAGTTMGGFTVGHLAKKNDNPEPAVIIGLRKEAGGIHVLLRYLTPQTVDAPQGPASFTVEVAPRGISCTWQAGPTVHPHKRPRRQTIHEFGTVPAVVPKGYSLLREVCLTEAEILQMFKGKPVVLVRSAPSAMDDEKIRVGVFAWQPRFSRWRHGGYYVGNVSHLNGGCGCVSNNYDDKKWRIVCDERRGNRLNEPGDFTFPSRDAAARAELEWTTAVKGM